MMRYDKDTVQAVTAFIKQVDVGLPIDTWMGSKKELLAEYGDRLVEAIHQKFEVRR